MLTILKHDPSVLKSHVVAWIGSFLGIFTVGFSHSFFLSPTDLPLYIGSLGATAVLLYAAPHSPLARVRNTVGGHIISAIVGVTVYMFIGDLPALGEALAVSCAIFAMLLTGTLHPPGGATALIAVIGSSKIHALGYLYVICPVASGVFLMLSVAFILDKTIKSHFVRW